MRGGTTSNLTTHPLEDEIEKVVTEKDFVVPAHYAHPLVMHYVQTEDVLEISNTALSVVSVNSSAKVQEGNG